MESILTSIKKLIGIAEDYNHFDTDMIIHINSVFMILNQLGVGPTEGFNITDATSTWDDYFKEDNKLYEAVKTYVYLKVKLIFDPPLNSAVIEAIKQQISEYEWRINEQAELRKEEKQNEI